MEGGMSVSPQIHLDGPLVPFISIYVQFFFFKQKAAYDFDCDWSSDVCSSDLIEDDPRERDCAQVFRRSGLRLVRHRRSIFRLERPTINAVKPPVRACTSLTRCRCSSRSASVRSEERRVGKEGRSRWSPNH